MRPADAQVVPKTDRTAATARPGYELPPLTEVTTPDRVELIAHRGSVGRLHAYAASLRGPSHAEDGTVREDSFALGAGQEGRVLFAALADGVGSTRDAFLASDRAAVSTVRRSATYFRRDGSWTTLAERVVREVGDELASDPAIRRSGRGASRSPDALGRGREHTPEASAATTLTFVVVEDLLDHSQVHWANVGDSAVLMYRWQQQDWIYICGASERRSDFTECLPGSALQESGQFILAQHDVLVLATDGLWKGIQAMPGQFAEVMRQVWESPLDSSEFANLLNFRGPALMDDRSAVVIRHADGRLD